MAANERTNERVAGDAYEELLRLGERTVDVQFKIMMDRLERTDRLIQLGVATVAGMIAVVGLFLAQGTVMDWPGMVGMGLSVLFVIGAVYLLARLNAGVHRDQFFTVGPALDDLFEEVRERDLSRSGLLRGLVEFTPLAIDSNLETIGSLSIRQDRAVLIYGVGVALHIGTIAYILGGLMLV